jgi:leader peptidase (prepilin peptidase)/N-methyltransferase
MYDGMPYALTVGGTAARVQRAWQETTFSVRITTMAAIAGSGTVSVGLPVTGSKGWWGVCGVLLTLAALVDVREHRLPNSLLALACASSLVPIGLRADPVMAGRALVGGGVAFAALALAHVARGVGMGDVKMAGVVGVSVGCLAWTAALVAVACAATAGALYGLLWRRRRVAFGPALWFGWMSALVGLSTGWWS